MSGIVGIINKSEWEVDQEKIRLMCSRIIHRGPDDDGYYLDGKVGLGIRRLIILEMEGDKQPISNEDDTVWIVKDGEIFNFRELRKTLMSQGHIFKTKSDTEVIIHLYEEYGLDCVKHLNGMFAFAIWDRKRKKMVLARDRLGKKPLIYANTKDGLIFASEIAAVLENETIEKRLNPIALEQYFSLWYTPQPLTMFEGVYKLPPAHLLIWEKEKMHLERYWDVNFSKKIYLSEAEWIERTLDLMLDCVKIRVNSEGKLGALLSGGIDSSTVVALMRRFKSDAIKTFSIGFEDDAYNELPYARQVSNMLGTEHHEEIVKTDAINILPKLIHHYGEPFGDDSCIPTYLASKLARAHVTVVLGGNGGDENFGGFNRILNYKNFNPADSIWGLFTSQARRYARKISKLQWSNNKNEWEFYPELIYRIKEITNPMLRYCHHWVVWKPSVRNLFSKRIKEQLSGVNTLEPLEKVWKKSRGWSDLDRLLYLELMNYTPDDLQVKMDIASMAASLEVRSPLLDYRLVELMAEMPPEMKFQNGETKHILRQIAKDLVPQTILQRKKWGFSVPLNTWMMNDLRQMAEDYLLDSNFGQQEIFDTEIVKQLVRKHMAGERDYSRNIWLLLNFEVWRRTFFEPKTV